METTQVVGPVTLEACLVNLLPMCDPIPDHVQLQTDHVQLQNRQAFVVNLMEVVVRMAGDPEERFDRLVTDIALDFRNFIEDCGASPWVLDSRWEDVFDMFFGRVDDLGGMMKRIFGMILATDEDLGLPGDLPDFQELIDLARCVSANAVKRLLPHEILAPTPKNLLQRQQQRGVVCDETGSITTTTAPTAVPVAAAGKVGVGSGGATTTAAPKITRKRRDKRAQEKQRAVEGKGVQGKEVQWAGRSYPG